MMKGGYTNKFLHIAVRRPVQLRTELFNHSVDTVWRGGLMEGADGPLKGGGADDDERASYRESKRDEWAWPSTFVFLFCRPSFEFFISFTPPTSTCFPLPALPVPP
mmetsp:Transcript_50411/g.99237  ORF Transcript_50411/g.99237 Transcript_50411/m.99237 type:complete len:106 (-) Transcript_50411:715-1032(-)